ncbi:peptidoglycan-binding protein [Arachnia propionica]|uniref:Peptidoglycan-binding protein n=1 Tax=Arachnia propionica TaxID=1750 RepID=A0A3P1WQV3_9ACTN|nr:peptidoglycan-binding protein [Arachnia propionica]RRD48218.1 peptidoglycan-binding protein [Arachnia propionica]
MQNNSPRFSRRSILSHAAIGLPAAGVLGVMAWAHPAATPEASAVEVDGWWGMETTRALQRVLGTHQDGIVSGQLRVWRSRYWRLVSGWEWDDGDGSSVIAAMQRRIGATPDGYFGPNTVSALNSHLSLQTVTHSEVIDKTVKALQWRLNQGWF